MRKDNNNSKQMSYVSLTQTQETFPWDIWLVRWVGSVPSSNPSSVSTVESAFHTSEVERMRIFFGLAVNVICLISETGDKRIHLLEKSHKS